jgi:hypothetical protein
MALKSRVFYHFFKSKFKNVEFFEWMGEKNRGDINGGH